LLSELSPLIPSIFRYTSFAITLLPQLWRSYLDRSASYSALAAPFWIRGCIPHHPLPARWLWQLSHQAQRYGQFFSLEVRAKDKIPIQSFTTIRTGRTTLH
jgi:hypothetical protein